MASWTPRPRPRWRRRWRNDSELDRRAQALADSAVALRAAFDDVLHEPVPERLLAAAHGETRRDQTPAETQTVVRFPEPRERPAKRASTGWRGWAALPIAASVASLVIGGTLGYFAATSPELAPKTAQVPQPNVQTASSSWLDNIAGYHKMFVAAGPNDIGLVDIPADPQNAARKLTQQLPQDFRLPNLKPWGLVFQGARFLFIEGRPATQLFYTTDNAALGPLTVVVASTSAPELQSRLRPARRPQRALLAAPGAHLCPRRQRRHRLPLEHPQRPGLAARRDLAAGC